MKLSILICTLESRRWFLDKLMYQLKSQQTSDVEILIWKDGGDLTIGEKRNKLLEKASGDYICFVDDDDNVSEQYVNLILNAIKTEPDCVGIKLLHYNDDVLAGLTTHSLTYDSWWDEPNKDNAALTNYYRNPNHLNPIKTSLARSVGFKHLDFGEDHDYSKRILPFLKNEIMIDEYIYEYRYRTNKND